MRLDHVSYVSSHEQIADTVQRIGAQLSTAFVDGGIHPSFGTRNFTAPLQNGQYVEIVCPLEHPAAEESAFGKAVAKKAIEGGGWLTWVISTDEISALESSLGRSAIVGHRRRPDGSVLKWKQLGVRDLLFSARSPFFIQWLTSNHPSSDGVATAAIDTLVISGKHDELSRWFIDASGQKLEDTVKCSFSFVQNDDDGLKEVKFKTSKGFVIIE